MSIREPVNVLGGRGFIGEGGANGIGDAGHAGRIRGSCVGMACGVGNIDATRAFYGRMALVPDPPKATSSDSDGEVANLLAAASLGDESAWNELVGRYGRRVFAMAKSRCSSIELAEEVTQSVFVTVASKLGHGGYTERGRFESWLFRVAMNRIRDEMRRRGRQAVPTDPAALPPLVDRGPTERADAKDLGRLREAMSRLSEPDREVIELRHHGQMSFRAMSELLNEPIGTLLARHHRALRKLRAAMEGAEVAEEVDA